MTTDTSSAGEGSAYYQSVPLEMKSLPNWVGWKLETRADNKPTKIPYSATGVLASSTDSATWRTFEDVMQIPPSERMGVGFVFNGNGIVGIDLDHCLDAEGNICDKFKPVVESLVTYTEVSPSGTGLHLFIKCKEKPYPQGRKKDDIEVYSEGRYFTVTGVKWRDDTPDDIIEYDAEIVRELCKPFLGELPVLKTPSLSSSSLSDYDIINIISHSANSRKFDQLMRGSIAEYANDASRADMALASILAFYTTDENQIERIMRGSGLRREKWDKHKTYLGDMTIRKAISMCTEHYEPTQTGDATHGLAVFQGMETKQEHPPTAQKPEPQMHTLSDKDIEDIKEALRVGDNLPPLPVINHPLFAKWMRVGSRLMYSRTPYHFGNLLAVASMALGRRVRTAVSLSSIYPNVYVMTVGTSTISGKSFAASTAVNSFANPVLAVTTLNHADDGSALIRKSHSSSRLIQELSSTRHILWYFDEAKEFFDECSDRGWNAPVIGNLCTAYDGDPLQISRSNKSRKARDTDDDNTWVCNDPFLSLLFNMTITQLKEASTKKIVGSGFFYRWMWFIENGGERKENATPSDEDMREVSELCEEIVRVTTLVKALNDNDITFAVSPRIEKWSIELSNKSSDETYQAATGRGVVQAYKIATILSMFDPEFQKRVLGQRSYPIRISFPDIWVEEAIGIVEHYLLPRMIAVVEYAEKVNVNNRQLLCLEALRSLGGISTHSALLRKTHMDRKEFSNAIGTLLESEEISAATDGRATVYHILHT